MSEIKDLKLTLKQFKQRVEDLNANNVKAGWLSGTLDPDSRFPLYKIAMVLNYGRLAGITKDGYKYPAIPPRPFMAYAKERFKKRNFGRDYVAYLKGKLSKTDFLKKLGAYMAGDLTYVLQRSEQFDFAPLNPQYVIQKQKQGYSHKLFRKTGSLIQEVKYAINGEKGENF